MRTGAKRSAQPSAQIVDLRTIDPLSPSRFINGRVGRLEEQFVELTGAPIRLARCQGNIRHRNVVPHNGFGLRRRDGQAGADRNRQGNKKHRISGAHELSSIGKVVGVPPTRR